MFTSKRKFSESIDLEEGETRQRRARRLTELSSLSSSHEYTRRPVSWHESLIDRLPQREEWEPRTAHPLSYRPPETGVRLPAIRTWQNIPLVPILEHEGVRSSSSDIFRGSLKNSFQADSSLPMLSRAGHFDAPLPRPESAPINPPLPSPGSSRRRTQLLDPWSPHSAPGNPTFEALRYSPRSELSERTTSHNLHSRFDRRSPERRWVQKEQVGIQPESSHHGSRIGVSTQDICAKVTDTSLEDKHSTSSISPTRKHVNHDVDMSSEVDARNFALSEHTSPAEQYNWEASEALAESGNRRRRGNLPKESTAVLNAWFCQHMTYPYPKEEEKHRLQVETGLSMSQV